MISFNVLYHSSLPLLLNRLNDIHANAKFSYQGYIKRIILCIKEIEALAAQVIVAVTAVPAIVIIMV